MKELDRVQVTETITVDGLTIPEGTMGTIVGVWLGGEAFEVEIAALKDSVGIEARHLCELPPSSQR